MSENYEPEGYWSERLEGEFSLRGTGHLGHSARYNDWVYRRKGRALKEALAATKNGGLALDIGSGVGWVVRQLLDYGLRVEGCDITDVAVKRLSAEFPRVPFFQAAVGTSPIPRDPETFDVVAMLDVAYHITDYALWRAAVEDVGRLLKPGGVFIVTDRLGSTPARVSAHVQFRSQSEWDEAVHSAGMHRLDLKPLYTWLGRAPDIRGWRSLPGESRGAIEYLLDQYTSVGEPNLRWATFVK